MARRGAVSLLLSFNLFSFSPRATGDSPVEPVENSPASKALNTVSAAQAGLNPQALNEIDAIIEQEIWSGRIPGAVLVVGRNGMIAKSQAYGMRALAPRKQPMRLDTIFDLASCTKPVATVSMTMKLYEEGKISLDDRVERYVPEFGQRGKNRATIRNLLTHSSGLRPYATVDQIKEESGGLPPSQALIQYICSLAPDYEAGKGYKYSCLNYLLLMRINEQVAQTPAETYLRERIFGPLGMRDTGYELTKRQVSRCAPTTRKPNGEFLKGEVHDPLANFYKTAAAFPGNAGLFSTAQDLSIFLRMLLNHGSFNGVRIFKPDTVELMLTPQSPAESGALRTCGWAVLEDPSQAAGASGAAARGPILYHTGWTGTYLWLDRGSDTFMVLLTNREHPNGGDAGLVRQKCVEAVLRGIEGRH